ncbi:TIGR02302 family protein [Bartonella tamiae]|uniref:TIGR02302 family protein n=1 Tax=Bartonella tamiae Th239 TaxID=1094558 RepID=J0R5P2_9HYPH|nr:TIGR02302 family protein [Bartonella tamiae]EJF90999.1 TIGR02302 family protein [Bartonella tamiae Th239]EJF93336.1 TIGR02302 family protein [Bartonella tamiae Th307]
MCNENLECPSLYETNSNLAQKQSDRAWSLSKNALKFARKRAFYVLTFERLWPCIMPLVLIVMMIAGLAWFGVFYYLGPITHIFLLVIFSLLALWSLFLFKNFHFVKQRDIDARIEQTSNFKNQPLEALNDRPVNGQENAFSQSLWNEHQRRMAAQLGALRVGLPDSQIPKHDPYALRALVVLFMVIAFVFSFGSKGGYLSDVFSFQIPVHSSLMRVDVWVTPPAYTRQAPIYLTNNNVNQAEVPQKSIMTVRVSDGGKPILKVEERESGEEKYPLSLEKNTDQQNASKSFEIQLDESSTITLSARHYERQWHIDVVKDHAPTIRMTKEPSRVLSGSLELNYSLEDDYGVEKAYVEIEPTQTTPLLSHPLYESPQISLLIPRNGKGKGRTVADISNHPWAGSEVRVTLVAEDGAGQVGKSETRTIILPQRIFAHPLARAVVEQRRILALDPMQRNSVMDTLWALIQRPEETLDNVTHFLALRIAWTQLSLANNDEDLRRIADYMWQIAINIDGDMVNQAQKQLKQAQAALRDALRNGAPPEEIERLTQALRDAMSNYIAALAKDAQTRGLEQTPNTNNYLSQNELEDKLRQLEDMAKTGNRGAAEQLLSELENMMDNLIVQQDQGNGQGQTGGQAGAQGQMQQQLDKLADLLRRQQEALNKTHKLEEEHNRGEKTQEEYLKGLDQLRENQQNLQSELKALQKELGAQGLEPGEELNSAEGHMGHSSDALTQGNGEQSAQNQADALNSLREGAQVLMKKMQEAMKAEENGDGSSDGRNSSQTQQDPLGRETGSGKASNEQTGNIPLESETERARRILDEIRKRLGQSLTPQMEKNYLERLLNFD